MSQRITFYATLVQREKLVEWLEKQKSIGSFAIAIVTLVNISSMSFKYRVRRCMVLLELLYFNACSTVTKFNCYIEILKIWNIWNSIHNRLFQKVPLKKNIYIRNNTYSCFTSVQIINIAASSLPFSFFFSIWLLKILKNILSSFKIMPSLYTFVSVF
jgi:hypothetical protein